MKKLSVDQINYINIGLMVIAAVAAFFKPFETFLFAYAFFGPLHYLTEISWLHDKQYFTKGKYDFLFLLGAGVLITLSYFDILKSDDDSMKGFSTAITFIAFGAALVFVLTKNNLARIGWIALIALIGYKLRTADSIDNIFGAFLPTLIHVFIFTGLFILVGALKGRNFSGILSLVVFIVISIMLFKIHPERNYPISDYVHNSFGYVKPDGTPTDGFFTLNYTVTHVFKMHEFGHPGITQSQFIDEINNYIYHAPLALALMAFIAFAYLYHYLNWFSKTSVIQWHNIPRSRFAVVIGLWIVSLALYMYDYSVGLKWLFFLSFTHVLLEFPLNHLTFINIGKEIGNIFSSGKFAKN